ncbi:vacuolar protein sorting-associated protein VTA1 homolog [Ciona intestinalis]
MKMDVKPLPPVPDKLKIVRPYINAAKELKSEAPVASYYCNIYALERAMKPDVKKDPDAKGFLLNLMDYAEAHKQALLNHPDFAEDIQGGDGAGYEVVYGAAMELFVSADKQDRESNFNKHLVRTFYTSAILFDVLQTFKEELPDKVVSLRKYARWKATYIHRCLKNNEAPIPGPIGDEEGPLAGESYSTDNQAQPGPSYSAPGPSSSTYADPGPSSYTEQPKPNPRVQRQPEPQPQYEEDASSTDAGLSPDLMQQAEKLCKHAGSALQYEDVPGAINLLEKCLKLLRTGEE